MQRIQREFFTVDEIAEAHELAIGMNTLRGIAAELNAAFEVHATARDAGRSPAAMAARRVAYAEVGRLRDARNASIVALALDLRVGELAAIAGVSHTQVGQALRRAGVPVPVRPRGGPQGRRGA